MSLKLQALHAFKWSVLGEIAARAIGPLVFLVLARLLIPEDFGVVAAATVVISFSQVFSDAGLSKALIQRQRDVAESANVVFWVNLSLGVLVVGVLVIGAPVIAAFFHDDRITAVVRVSSLQILFSAISSVHTALLQKDLNFKRLFWVRLVTSTAPSLISITFAVNGMGYWALVVGALFGQMAQSILLWTWSRWRPRWGIDRALTWQLMSFGKWAMLSGLLGWFYAWMDAVVVGHFLGSHDMGLYRTANTFVAMIFGVVFSPTLPVLYSALSRANGDNYKIREALLLVARTFALIGLPIGFWLFVLKDDISASFFGAEWAGLNIVIGVMALTHGFAWLVGANGEAYRSINKPHVETWVNATMMPVYATGYLLSVRMGLQAFLLTRLALAFLAICAHIFVAWKVLGVNVSDWLPTRPLMISIMAVVLVDIAEFDTTVVALRLIVLTAVFAAATIAGAIILQRQLLTRLLELATTRVF